MNIIAPLEAGGLSKNEAAVYVALLQQGPSSALSVSRATSLKRPTVYLILDDLIRKGFAALVPGEKKKLFLALPPERLEEEMQRRARLIRKAIPELSALYQARSGRPTMRFFESQEGILNVYREIAAEKPREIMSFVSLESIPKDLSEIYEIFIDMYRHQGIAGREIISAKDSKHFYIEQLRKAPHYEYRFVETGNAFFTDNIIYGNKMATFSSKKRFAFVVESEDVVSSWRSLFELAWQSAGIPRVPSR